MKNTNDPQLTQNTPFQGRVSNGFLMLFVSLLLIAAGIACICLAEGYKTEIAGYLYIITNTAAHHTFSHSRGPSFRTDDP